MKLVALTLVGLLSTCGTANDSVEDPLPRPQQPNPNPQVPAPNADPAPTQQREKKITFRVDQGSYHYVDITHSFIGPGVQLTPPTARVANPNWSYDLWVSTRGIAKITVEDRDRGGTTIYCSIYVNDVLEAESHGTRECTTFTPISF